MLRGLAEPASGDGTRRGRKVARCRLKGRGAGGREGERKREGESRRPGGRRGGKRIGGEGGHAFPPEDLPLPAAGFFPPADVPA